MEDELSMQQDLEEIEAHISELEDRVYGGGAYPGEERMLEDLLDERDEVIARLESLDLEESD